MYDKTCSQHRRRRAIRTWLARPAAAWRCGTSTGLWKDPRSEGSSLRLAPRRARTAGVTNREQQDTVCVVNTPMNNARVVRSGNSRKKPTPKRGRASYVKRPGTGAQPYHGTTTTNGRGRAHRGYGAITECKPNWCEFQVNGDHRRHLGHAVDDIQGAGDAHCSSSWLTQVWL